MATLAYTALIVYGSLYPFTGWRSPATLFAFLGATLRGHWARPDMLINVLAYVPLGFLLARTWTRWTPAVLAAILALFAGGALSFTMESVQQYLPSRVASVGDILTNTLGAFVGAALAGFVHAEGSLGATFSTWRSRRFREGRLADLGLISIGLWVLSQLAPFVPTDDFGELRHSLAPLWATLRDPAHFNFAQWGAYAANITGLALLARTLGRPERSVTQLFFSFVACVLILKAPIETRQLSLEAIAGALAAAIVAPLMTGMRLKVLARAGALFILGGFCIAETASGKTPVAYPFAWVPFTAQMEHPLIGMLSTLENVWPAAALAYLIRFATPVERRRTVGWIGGFVLTGIVFALEWHKQRIPGRVGDITTVLLIVGTWAVFWALPVPDDIVPKPVPMPQRLASRHTRLVAGTLLLGAAVLRAAAIAANPLPRYTRGYESKLASLPAPTERPFVSFAQFELKRRRLPITSSPESPRLQVEDPKLLSKVGHRGASGARDVDSATLQVLLAPWSASLTWHGQRLRTLKVTWRASNHVKPLCVVYDWCTASGSLTSAGQCAKNLSKPATTISL